jgi:uncharacterized protein YecE (DUF72 family)
MTDGTRPHETTPAYGPAEVRVGTSGYSFEDWRGTFYPQKIDKGKMLDYYVLHFPTVEINSTYYRIPHSAVMSNIARKAPEGFDFMVKVPQSFTHRRTDLDGDLGDYSECLKPLQDTGRLSGLLAQFPWSFKFSDNALDYVSQVARALAPNPLFVEFRHQSWVNRQMYDRLRSEKIGYVCVDEPQLPNLLAPDAFATTDTAYIRLHGRNAARWWDGGPLRYDYSYSQQELNEWKQKVRKLQNKVKRVYVFFNNCHEGQAVGNAREFVELLRKV